MSAYDEAAQDYLDAGHTTIPVRGKSIPVKGPTGYSAPVTREQIEGWLVADLDQRARNGRGVGVDNIGIRHHRTLAIDVDEGYRGKKGAHHLAEFAARLGLPPLPATASSTARGDKSPSRQYLYRITEDVTFKTKPCTDVELCAWHHRFTVCWPSVHPDTHTPYRWYLPGEPGVPPTWGAATDTIPGMADLAALPPEWFTAFRGAIEANADRDAATVAVPDLLASFRPGEPDGLVHYLIQQWSAEDMHVGHDEAKNALIHAFLLGREGHPGVPELYRLLVERLTAYLAVARPGEAHREAASLVVACADIAQQKPLKPENVRPPAEQGPVDPDTWAAFLATFTDDPCPWMGANRQKWTRDAILSRPRSQEQAFREHAVKAFGDVINGRYSAQRAVDLLTAVAPTTVTDLSTTLRASLSAALTQLEGATR